MQQHRSPGSSERESARVVVSVSVRTRLKTVSRSFRKEHTKTNYVRFGVSLGPHELYRVLVLGSSTANGVLGSHSTEYERKTKYEFWALSPPASAFY